MGSPLCSAPAQRRPLQGSGQGERWIAESPQNKLLGVTIQKSPGHCFLKCGSLTSSISVTWAFVTKVASRAPPHTYLIRNSGVGPSNLCFHKPPR